MTKTELQAMSLKQLTAVYNQHAAKPIKSFSGSKEEAVKRVLGVLPKAKSEIKKPRTGVGAFIRECLGKGKLSPAEIVDAAKKQFPECSTNVKCVAWYKNRMKEEGAL